MAHQEGEIVNQAGLPEYRALFQLDWVKLLLLGNQGLLAVTRRHFPTAGRIYSLSAKISGRSTRGTPKKLAGFQS